MKILNFYASVGGNTERVAQRIGPVAADLGHEVETIAFKQGTEVDFLAYDFVFIGSGVYGGLPQGDLLAYLRSCMKSYKKAGHIKPGCPRISKTVVTYCTYSGNYTGDAEAITTNRVLYTLFDRLGFYQAASWQVIGAYLPENMQQMNINGRLGDIRNRPNENDLKEIEEKVKGILKPHE